MLTRVALDAGQPNEASKLMAPAITSVMRNLGQTSSEASSFLNLLILSILNSPRRLYRSENPIPNILNSSHITFHGRDEKNVGDKIQEAQIAGIGSIKIR